MRQTAALLLCAVLLAAPVSGCTAAPAPPGGPEDHTLRSAVLYYGEDRAWEDAWSHLEQSLLVNLTVEAADVSQPLTLADYDLLYPDPSILEAPGAPALLEALVAYTEAGGALFLDNAFAAVLPAPFLGIQGRVKLTGCPVALEAAGPAGDLDELRSIVLDFASLYPDYTDYGRLSGYDYGWGFLPGSAQPLVTADGLALYTMNRYGKGYVFLTNPLLPNLYSVNGFSLESRDARQVSLANSTAGANQLLRNAFAGYVSKRRFGYAPYRVFGVLGRPSMAWELHVEDIDGIARETTTAFAALCRAAGQIPSYTLVRSTYYWLARLETVSYARNLGTDGAFSFEMDFEENAYSSGTHVASGDRRLALGVVENAGSYFLDYPEYDQRAYPYAADLDGDGTLDLLCGAADGRFSFYRGAGGAGRFTTEEAVLLHDPAGDPLSVPGYSAPVLADVDGDGVLDLISGAADGRLYWFAGCGGLVFQPRGLLIDTGLDGQILPDIGDWDGDGRPDLLAGSSCGVLRLYRGGAAGRLDLKPARHTDLTWGLAALGGWLAPRMVDLDGDGRLDLAVGTFDGYVARLMRRTDGSLRFGGFLSAQETNYKGSRSLKFGNNCVPFFADVDGDGAPDLLAGCLEYGLACAIDGDDFPYRAELQRAVDALQADGAYLGLHFYTNVHASPEREAAELAAHLRALESYGIGTARIGANQHTWHLSRGSHTQSFRSLWEAGLLWNSGFEPARSSATPQVSAENVLALPFFLRLDGAPTLLLQNSATLTYGDEAWPALSARYGMPVCLYYHCDWLFQDHIRAEAENTIAQAGAFQRTYQYNFVREDQMMLATAAAYHLTLAAGEEDGVLTLTPGTSGTDYPLYEERYQNACGVRLSFAQGADPAEICTDADVWCWVDGDLYVGLNRPVRVWRDTASPASHLAQVNLPAVIETGGNGVTRISFQEGGMMQAVVEGPVQCRSGGWTRTEDGDRTVFTRFGPAQPLSLFLGHSERTKQP